MQRSSSQGRNNYWSCLSSPHPQGSQQLIQKTLEGCRGENKQLQELQSAETSNETWECHKTNQPFFMFISTFFLIFSLLRFRKNTFPPPEEHKIMTWNGLNLNWIIDVSPQLCEGMDDGKIALYWNGQSCEHRAELKASWGSRLVSSGQIFLYSPFQCEPQVAWRGGWCGGKIRQSEHWCWGEQTGWWQTRGKSETFFYQSRKCKLISTRENIAPKPYTCSSLVYMILFDLWSYNYNYNYDLVWKINTTFIVV